MGSGSGAGFAEMGDVGGEAGEFFGDVAAFGKECQLGEEALFVGCRDRGVGFEAFEQEGAVTLGHLGGVGGDGEFCGFEVIEKPEELGAQIGPFAGA